jgi:hypothetical protein
MGVVDEVRQRDSTRDSKQRTLLQFVKKSIKVYLVESKTRHSTRGMSATQKDANEMQLMIYYHLLFSMVKGFDFANLAIKIGMDPNKILSDSFLAQAASNMGLDNLFERPTLNGLWDIASTRLRTITLDNMLMMVYRDKEGKIDSTYNFALNLDRLNSHISNALLWWKGKRPSQGVPVDQVYKCYICPFYEGCVWRSSQADRAWENQRLAKQ